jgi:hypothetical protein
MIKVSTFLRECLNEIEMKKYLSLYSVDGTCTMPHASAGTKMFQGKKIKIFVLKKKIQSHRGFSIASVDDGYAATSV